MFFKGVVNLQYKTGAPSNKQFQFCQKNMCSLKENKGGTFVFKIIEI